VSRTVRNINQVSGKIIRIALRFILYAAIIFAVIKGISVAYRFGHSIFYATSVEASPGRDVSITVGKSTDAKTVAAQLKKKGLIENEWSFRIQAIFFNFKIKSGNYTLNTSQTSKDMLETLDAGPETQPAAATKETDEDTGLNTEESAQSTLPETSGGGTEIIDAGNEGEQN